MCHAVLAIAVPLAVGLAAGHLVAGVLAGVGRLLATMADRAGPYPMRVRRVATAAVSGGAAGLLIAMAVNGRGWVALPVMIAVAGVSALLSSVGAVWSSASLFLLIFAALGTGPIGCGVWSQDMLDRAAHYLVDSLRTCWTASRVWGRRSWPAIV